MADSAAGNQHLRRRFRSYRANYPSVFVSVGEHQVEAPPRVVVQRNRVCPSSIRVFQVIDSSLQAMEELCMDALGLRESASDAPFAAVPTTFAPQSTSSIAGSGGNCGAAIGSGGANADVGVGEGSPLPSLDGPDALQIPPTAVRARAKPVVVITVWEDTTVAEIASQLICVARNHADAVFTQRQVLQQVQAQREAAVRAQHAEAERAGIRSSTPPAVPSVEGIQAQCAGPDNPEEASAARAAKKCRVESVAMPATGMGTTQDPCSTAPPAPVEKQSGSATGALPLYALSLSTGHITGNGTIGFRLLTEVHLCILVEGSDVLFPARRGSHSIDATLQDLHHDFGAPLFMTCWRIR